MVYNGKIKKIIIILCIIAAVISVIPGYASAAEPLDISSPSVIVAELSSGTVLMSENPDMSINPGGIIKIAALYAMTRECFRGTVSLSDEVTVTKSIITSDSGRIPLKEDEIFTLEQLMYLMYMDYSDTAAAAAAVHISGDIDSFVQKMNEIADEIGCTDTHFTNVTGAYDENQHTTPSDTLLILENAMQNSVFMDVFTAASYTVRETNKSIARSLGTPNLLQRPGSDCYVRACSGGRIGGFSRKGYATISLSEGTDSGIELIVITAGCDDYSKSYNDAYTIINWTFDNFSWQTVITAGDTIKRLPIEMGSGTDYVAVGASKDINVLTDNDITALDFDKLITVYSERDGETLKAPVKRGEVLGELTLSYDGKTYGTVPLVATRDVDLKRWEYFKSEVRATLGSSGVIWCIVAIIVLILGYLVYAVLFRLRQLKRKREIRAAREALIARRKKAIVSAPPTAEDAALLNSLRESSPTSENTKSEIVKPENVKTNNKPESGKAKDSKSEFSKPVDVKPEIVKPAQAENKPNASENVLVKSALGKQESSAEFTYDFSLDMPIDAAYEIMADAVNAENTEGSADTSRPY